MEDMVTNGLYTTVSHVLRQLNFHNVRKISKIKVIEIDEILSLILFNIETD